MSINYLTKRIARRWLCGIWCFLIFPSLALRADDFDTLINSWSAFYTGGTNINLADPNISSRVTAITTTANSYWSTLNTSTGRTYLWSDAASTTVSANVTTCYQRLAAMAQAYAQTGSSLYGNTNLAAVVLSGLDWMYTNRYNATMATYDNWWDWVIGAPTALDNAMVFLYPVISGTQITNYCNAIDHYLPSIPNAIYTGANRSSTAMAMGVRGAVGRNAAKVATARDALSDVSDGGIGSLFLYVTNSDGFYADGSFIQHQKQPYNAGYGAGLLDSVALMMAWLAPTQWKVTDPQSTNVVQWCYNAFEPLIYYGAMLDDVYGRSIGYSTGYAAGHRVIPGIFRMALSAPTNDAMRLNSMIKYWAQVDPTATLQSYVDFDLIKTAEVLLTNAAVVPRGELIGHYFFPNMDRDIHLRPGFGFALSMFSTRIYNYEYVNGLDLQGWFTAYGMGYLYETNDLTQYSDSFWPTVDSYHLPGTTTVLTPLAGGTNAAANSTQSWVGGAVLANSMASIGLSLADVNSSLTAKKSWFMFNNEIVCLGAGISCTSPTNVQTTVENRNLHSSNTNVFIVNGTVMPATLGWTSNLNNVSWCSLDVSGGYYFPGGTSIIASRRACVGSYSKLQVGASTTPITRNYVSLVFDHGIAPVNASYSYVLLPTFSANAVSNYAANPQVIILTNTTSVQAARETAQGVTAANFWKDDAPAADFISSDRMAAVVARETNNVLEIAVSDPTWTNTSTITLTLNRNATGLVSADPGVSILQLSQPIKLSIAVNGARGKTFQARFSTASTNAGINWGVPATILGDTDVSTNGTLLYAYNLSAATSAVNTVNFTYAGSASPLGGNVLMQSSSGGIGHGVAYIYNAAPANTLSTAYQTLLTGGNYGTATAASMTVTLTNLTFGHYYLVQIWANDSRSAYASRTETITSAGGNTVTLAYNSTGINGGVGQYSIGTFYAAGTAQSFILNSATSSQFNLIQVRDVTSGSAYFSGAADATWDMGTTADWSANSGGLYNQTWTAVGGNSGASAVFEVTANAVTVNGAVSVNNMTFATDDYTLGGGGTIAMGNGLITTGSGNDTISAVIGGSSGLTKSGAGTLKLTGTNTYPISTLISNGTLEVDGALASSSAVIIATNATLSGIGTVGGVVTVNGAIAPGWPSTIGTLTCLFNVALNGTTVMKLNQSAADASDMLKVGGGLVYGGTLNVTNLAGSLTTNDAFVLFSTPGSGAFTQVIPATPGYNLLWNTNTLNFDGTLRIVSAAVQPVFTGITWNAPMTIAGDSDVSTNGTLIYAYNVNTTAPTVNTVTFTYVNSNTSLGGNVSISGATGHAATSFGVAASPFSTLSSTYQTMLSGGDYGVTSPMTNTLKNLTAGHYYLAQVWANDSRSAYANRTETLTSVGGNTITLAYNNTGANGGVGQYSMGYFIATNTSQSFIMTGNASGQFNLMQVRDLTSWVAYFNGANGTNWDAGTTADWATASGGSYNQTWLAAGGSYGVPAVFGGAANNVTVSGTINVGGIRFATDGYTLGGNGTLTLGIGAITTGVGADTISAVLAGSVGLTKSGAGKLILSGTNTYIGTTVISNGTLEVDGKLAPSSAVIVPANGILTGSGTVGGPVTVNGTIEPGTINTIGTLTGSSSLTLHGTNVMKLNQANADASDMLAVSGGLVYGGTLYVTNLSGTLTAADSFKLFSTAGSGVFAKIVPAIPGAGLLWNTNTLATDGTLRIASVIVPSPVITEISLSGTTLHISATNGVAGRQYVLLGSTNLALPLPQWTRLLTNSFDGAGNLNLTTGLLNSNTSMGFYLISQ